jgi:hypothetical protein
MAPETQSPLDFVEATGRILGITDPRPPLISSLDRSAITEVSSPEVSRSTVQRSIDAVAPSRETHGDDRGSSPIEGHESACSSVVPGPDVTAASREFARTLRLV